MIPKTKPEEFGLTWYDDQRLPEPFKEVTLFEATKLLHCGTYGLEGINFNQLFLDWGDGPRADNPERWETYMDRVYYEPKINSPVIIKGMEGRLVACRRRREGDKNNWSIYREIDAEVNGEVVTDWAERVKIVQMNYGYGGWEPFQNFWSVHYYFSHLYGVAVAERYCSWGTYKECGVLENRTPFMGEFITGIGHFIPANSKVQEFGDRDYGFAIRFFKLGCEHQWRELSKEEANSKGHSHYGMFCHINECEKCGQTWTGGE
jgi:hypothetical protein